MKRISVSSPQRAGRRPHGTSAAARGGFAAAKAPVCGLLLRGGLLLCLATAALAQNPPQNPQQDPQIPTVLEERANVRRFSAGISLTVAPLTLMNNEQLGMTEDTRPPVEYRSNVDPNTRLFNWGFVAQVALTERMALAVHPTFNKVRTHTTYDMLVGVDNAATSFDDRDKTSVDEQIMASTVDIPLLWRLYNIDRHENGNRWFFEAGGTWRLTRNARVDRRIFPPGGGELNESVPFPVKKNTYGATVGIGGQFIDDFGIRAIPEFRFTRFFNRAFDSFEGRSRLNQMEFLLTISF